MFTAKLSGCTANFEDAWRALISEQTPMDVYGESMSLEDAREVYAEYWRKKKDHMFRGGARTEAPRLTTSHAGERKEFTEHALRARLSALIQTGGPAIMGSARVDAIEDLSVFYAHLLDSELVQMERSLVPDKAIVEYKQAMLLRIAFVRCSMTKAVVRSQMKEVRIMKRDGRPFTFENAPHKPTF
jgi:hypothetical protein